MKIIRLEANGQETLCKLAKQDFVSFGRKPTRLHYIRKSVGMAVCNYCQQMLKCYQYGVRHVGGRVVWDQGSFCCKNHYLMGMNQSAQTPLASPAPIPAQVV